jgi:flagellar hook-associated protein 2
MNISGLSSNIDTSQIIQELLSVDKNSINNLKIKESVINKKKEIYNDILNRINNLKNLAVDLQKEKSFNVYKISYSDTSIVQFSLNSNVKESSYSITVNNLATNHTIGSDKKGSSTEALNLNNGIIKINGVDIEINNQDSLNSIRDKINSSNTTGVTASIIDNTLILKSNSSGLVNQINLVDDNNILVDLGILNNDLTFKNQFVAPSDASIIFDGQTITSSSNLISNTIEGITLQLLKKGSVDVSINRDLDNVATKIKNFVNQYNSVVDLIYSKITEKRVYPIKTDTDRFIGLVNGDETLNNVKNNLNDLIFGSVSDLSDTFKKLEDIGITKSTFNQSGDNSSLFAGKLNVDDAKLNESLNENFSGVMNLFIKNYGIEGLNSSDYGIGVRMTNYLNLLTDFASGVFKNMSKSFDEEIKMLEEQANSMEIRLSTKEEALTKKFTAMELAISNSNNQLAWLQMQINNL